MLDVGFDGAKIWLNKQFSTGFLVMRPWDVPYEVRGKADFTSLLAVYREEPKSGGLQDLFLEPFVKEMESLCTVGMEVDDPHLKRSYLSKWFLGTISADTPARNLVGKFVGVAGYRADYRSLF